MIKATSGRDLFGFGNRGGASSGAPKWKPRRRNGFAAALAVIVETGKSGGFRRGLRLLPELPPEQPELVLAPATTRTHWTEVEAPEVEAPELLSAPIAQPSSEACGSLFPDVHAEPMARCPKCGIHGEVKALFGTRMIDGKPRRQSWCRSCRKAQRHAKKPAMVREAEQFAREGIDNDES